jgi:hypothetical protein
VISANDSAIETTLAPNQQVSYQCFQNRFEAARPVENDGGASSVAEGVARSAGEVVDVREGSSSTLGLLEAEGDGVMAGEPVGVAVSIVGLGLGSSRLVDGVGEAMKLPM